VWHPYRALSFAAAIGIAVAGTARAAGAEPPRPPAPGTGLLAAAGEFRVRCLSDHRDALARFASEEVRRTFLERDAQVWPTVTPRVGWSYFFGTSVWTATQIETGTPHVAFYHPWSDVYLLTTWRATGGTLEIIDAALAMGDWLRGDDATLQLVPQWLRAEDFAPAALARTGAAALEVFEAATSAGKGWRTSLPATGKAAQFNIHGATLLLAGALRSARSFAWPEPGEPARLTALRRAVADARRQASDGELSKLVAGASETLPPTAKLLAGFPPDFMARLEVVHALAAGVKRSVVFLSPPGQGDLVLSLVYEEGQGRPLLRRLDLLSFSAAYQARQVGAAGAQP